MTSLDVYFTKEIITATMSGQNLHKLMHMRTPTESKSFILL